MARCKYLQTDEQNRAAALEDQKAKLSREIYGAIMKIRRDYTFTQEQFAEQVGMKSSTFSNRIKNPSDFSFEEYLKIKSRFPVLAADIAKILTS